MYAFAIKNDRVLVYQRDTTGQHSDSRLTGKISVGIGGHMDPTDLSLEDSLWREVDEEAEVVMDGQVLSFRTGLGELNIDSMREVIEITPMGMIKDGRDSVGAVHLGVACMVAPRKENVEIRLKTGEEAVHYSYLTLDDYDKMISSDQVVPEGWTEMVIRHEIRPLLSSS